MCSSSPTLCSQHVRNEVKVMEQAVFAPSRCQLSLRNVLCVHEQPVCEEQAWALCYQLCSLLDRTLGLRHHHHHHHHHQHHGDDDGQTYSSWKSFRLPGAEGIFLRPDGTISLRMEHGKVAEHQFVIETEAQTVDYVGRLMYSCLDWGLGADVERDLDETLELLVDQMTRVDVQLADERCLQPIRTISEVLQVCEDRLYNPGQAAQHYRSVCATLYSHTVELFNYLQIIRQTQEGLQNLIMESGNNLVPATTTAWFTWRHLMDELSRGVVLRPPRDQVDSGVCPPVDASPFSQLLRDIQLRRYTLRKVTALECGGGGRRVDPHQALLDVIRSGPKLRPVSERKLKPRFQKPSDEVSLHELLMQEIRSSDPAKLLSSRPGRRLSTVIGSQSPIGSEINVSPVKTLKCVKDDTNDDGFFFQDAVPSCGQERAPYRELTCKDGSTPLEDSYTAGVKNLSFFPALSSTPLSLSEECRLFQGKRRARSLPSNPEIRRPAQKSTVSVPSTIAEVVTAHYRKEEKSSGNADGNWRVCSCCAKRSLYFTWHNRCSLCKRVVCPECCLEIMMLKTESEESQRRFWNERLSWDPSRVPLVLVSPWVSGPDAPHRLAMRDWHSQEVCAGCQDLLLDVCDSPAPPFVIKEI